MIDDPDIQCFLHELEFWVTNHYLAENYYTLKQQSDRESLTPIGVWSDDTHLLEQLKETTR